jgi:hypothetical protein
MTYISKHTPGPWETDEDGDRICIWVPAVKEYVAIIKDFGWDAPYQANGRLIAAAPDLLDALKGVVRIADRQTVEFDAARAAIAKAEGR